MHIMLNEVNNILIYHLRMRINNEASSVRGFREPGAKGQKRPGAGNMGVRKTGSREIMKQNLGVI